MRKYTKLHIPGSLMPLGPKSTSARTLNVREHHRPPISDPPSLKYFVHVDSRFGEDSTLFVDRLDSEVAPRLVSREPYVPDPTSYTVPYPTDAIFEVTTRSAAVSTLALVTGLTHFPMFYILMIDYRLSPLFGYRVKRPFGQSMDCECRLLHCGRLHGARGCGCFWTQPNKAEAYLSQLQRFQFQIRNAD
jgi:hypothetical protein